jgi:hypothetical protein
MVNRRRVQLRRPDRSNYAKQLLPHSLLTSLLYLEGSGRGTKKYRRNLSNHPLCFSGIDIERKP